MRNERQQAAFSWVQKTFGASNAHPRERARRFIEEAIELAQAEGLTSTEVQNVVTHVYGKKPGDPQQEAGGVGVTLLAYCESKGFSADKAELAEFERVSAIDVEYFRRRHDAKAVAGIASFVDEK